MNPFETRGRGSQSLDHIPLLETKESKSFRSPFSFREYSKAVLKAAEGSMVQQRL